MSSVVRPSTAEDEAQIVDLLTRVFSAASDAPFVNPDLLRWKYWEPRADCSDPRSLVFEKGGRIVAHAGLWPVTVRTNAGDLRGVHMIDWASDPQAIGAGVSLLQRLTKSYDFVYAIGGTEATRTVLPRFGFRTVASALTFARPLRPWRQVLQHQSRDVRLPLRLARNIWWSKMPAKAAIPGWTATEADVADLGGHAVQGGERDRGFFRYLQQCPSARLLCFDIWNEGRKSGFFALAWVAEQARLAGVVLENPVREQWRIAFQLAQDAALRYTAASELVARSTGEDSAAAATQAGMRLRARTPVFLFRRGKGGREVPLEYQMWDNDGVFWRSHRTDFLT